MSAVITLQLCLLLCLLFIPLLFTDVLLLAAMQTKGNGFYWIKHLAQAGITDDCDAETAATGSKGSKRKSKGSASQPSAAGESGAGPRSGASSSRAAAKDAAAGSGQQQISNTGIAAPANQAAGAAVSGGGGAARSGGQKRKHDAVGSSDAVANSDSAADKQADASNKRSGSSRAAKSGGSAGASKNGCSRPRRRSAAEAQEAVKKQLEQEATPLRKLRAMKLQQQQQLQKGSPVQDAAAQRDTAAAAVESREGRGDDQLLVARKQGMASAGLIENAEEVLEDEAVVDPSSNRSSVDVLLPAALE